MRVRLLPGLLTLVLLAASCANEDDEEQRDPTIQGDSARTEDLSDREVASLLAFIDGSEIATARQLLPKLSTPPARSYAQMLIDDHTRMRALARERTEIDDSSAAPPQFTTLRAVTASQSAMLMTLPSGRSFDATFLGVQAANHAMVLDSLRAWRSTVDDEGLRSTIDAALPVIDAHRARALTAFGLIQGDTNATRPPPPVLRPDSAGPRPQDIPGPALAPDSTTPETRR